MIGRLSRRQIGQHPLCLDQPIADRRALHRPQAGRIEHSPHETPRQRFIDLPPQSLTRLFENRIHETRQQKGGHHGGHRQPRRAVASNRADE